MRVSQGVLIAELPAACGNPKRLFMERKCRSGFKDCTPKQQQHRNPMKKALLITAASLFVIGQAFAQAQPQPTPVNPSSRQNTESGTPRAPNASSTAAKPDKPMASERRASKRSMSKGKRSHRMGRHHMKRHHMGRHHHRHRGSMHGMHHQQGWGWGPQQGWQHPWGWHQSGKCRNNTRRDGSWCM